MSADTLTRPWHTLLEGNAHRELEATSHLRLNVGCGEWPLMYWLNLDADPTVQADITATVPPIPAESESLHEIYAGHFLEHLSFEAGAEFLRECYRVLVPGGKLGLMVPDTRLIMARWLRGEIDNVCIYHDDQMAYYPIADLDAVCALFLYSTVQDSRHLWSYDLRTLRRAGERTGFEYVGEIDRYTDPRVGTGHWYQCGADFIKPGGE